MFSHVVIFWTKPEKTNAADDLLAGAEKYLRPIPGVQSFHIGKMVPSLRPVVEQSYQIALNLIFSDKRAQDDYQVHPLHVEFVEKAFKPNCARCVVYDFE
jgi:stress responsive alpha/beta barrel protein